MYYQTNIGNTLYHCNNGAGQLNPLTYMSLPDVGYWEFSFCATPVGDLEGNRVGDINDIRQICEDITRKDIVKVASHFDNGAIYCSGKARIYIDQNDYAAQQKAILYFLEHDMIKRNNTTGYLNNLQFCTEIEGIAPFEKRYNPPKELKSLSDFLMLHSVHPHNIEWVEKTV